MNYLRDIVHRVLSFFRLVKKDLKYLDPTNLAILQDEILANHFISEDAAKKYFKELKRFNILFTTKLVVHNNLYIRSNVIFAGLRGILNNYKSRDEFLNLANDAFRHNIRDGFYMENFQYFRYVIAAYERFSYFNHENSDQVQLNYNSIASQTGVIALTTAVNSPVVPPCTKNGMFHYGPYTVYRTDRIYLLITHNTNIYDFKTNFHVKWDFGHYYLMVDGKAWVDQEWYGGYVKNLLANSNQTWVNNVICDDLINMEPFWRIPNGLKDTEIKVLTSTDTKIILGIGPNITRTFEISPDKISVTDEGGSYTAFSLNKANYASIHAVYEGKCVKNHSILKDRVYCKLTGHKRTVRFDIK